MRKALSHVDAGGRARMVDVTRKPDTLREAVARGSVFLSARTLSAIARGSLPKGDVLATARVAGIMAAKGAGRLIPLCHPLCLTHVSVDFRAAHGTTRARLDIEAKVSLVGKTGAEMEALSAVAVSALTVYDMCKAVERSMRIGNIHLVRKSGGKSGVYVVSPQRRGALRRKKGGVKAGGRSGMAGRGKD
jgi:cyclic pyranopterin monophosphate synthase